MFLTTYLLLLLWHLALLTSAQSLTFTGPATSTSLNLSAPIQITWTEQQGSPYSQVDLSFTGPVTGGTVFGYGIATNLSLSSGQFTWDPRNVSASLQSTHLVLVPGSMYMFKAMVHNEGSTSGDETQSGEYQVAGYPYLGAAAGRGRGAGALMMLSLGLIVLRVVV